MSLTARSLLRRFFLLIMFSSGSLTVAFAGNDSWTSIGPPGGKVTALAVDPSNDNVIYAGTGGGIFKSTSGGASWAAINNGIHDPNNSLSTNVLTIDPSNTNIVYAGTLNKCWLVQEHKRWRQLELSHSFDITGGINRTAAHHLSTRIH